MAQVSACGSWENELRSLAQIDEPPYDVTQQSAQRGPLGDTWYNHLESFIDIPIDIDYYCYLDSQQGSSISGQSILYWET